MFSGIFKVQHNLYYVVGVLFFAPNGRFGMAWLLFFMRYLFFVGRTGVSAGACRLKTDLPSGRNAFSMSKRWFAAAVGCTAAAAVILLSPAGTRTDSSLSVTNTGGAYTSDSTGKAAEDEKSSDAASSSRDTEASGNAKPENDAALSSGSGTASNGTGRTTGSTSDSTQASNTTDGAAAADTGAAQPESTASGEESDAESTVPEVDTAGLDISSIKKGTDFYPDNLKKEYGITFSDDFGQTMADIESEFLREHGLAASRDTYARNWQDAAALLLLDMQHDGADGTFLLDNSCKDRLAEIFASINEVVPADNTDGNTVICKYAGGIPSAVRSIHIADILKLDDERAVPLYSESDRAFLRKYTEGDCLLLYVASTHADGFICQNTDGLSTARTEIVRDACSLVGKVSYFWGGKSTVIGIDSRWGSPSVVSAAGSDDSGLLKSYGLDCSGFVSWSFLNGAAGSGKAVAEVGNGTTDQWNASTAVSTADARPGDLVFLQVPTAHSINHVGIVAGRTSDGNLIAVHCNAGDNGVVIEDAYKAGFRYVRRPNCLTAADQ